MYKVKIPGTKIKKNKIKIPHTLIRSKDIMVYT